MIEWIKDLLGVDWTVITTSAQGQNLTTFGQLVTAAALLIIVFAFCFLSAWIYDLFYKIFPSRKDKGRRL